MPLLRRLPFACLLVFAALVFAVPLAAQDAGDVRFPAQVQQGSLVIGKVPAGSQVRYRDRALRVSGYGTVVLGVGRDEAGPVQVEVTRADGSRQSASIAITPRDWPVERVNGVPPATVNPPAAIAERIRREQAQVTEARVRDDDRVDFGNGFIRPVEGRISGRFGRARSYNGQPGAPHSGMDIAAPPARRSRRRLRASSRSPGPTCI